MSGEPSWVTRGRNAVERSLQQQREARGGSPPPPASSSPSRGSSSSNNTNQQIINRARELQEGGVNTPLANQLARAEIEGRTITNITPDIAREISRAGGSSAVRRQDLQRASQVLDSDPVNRGVINNQVYDRVTQQEIQRQQLNTNTRAVLLRNETARREEVQSRIDKGEELKARDTAFLLTPTGSKGFNLLDNQENLREISRFNREAKEFQASKVAEKITPSSPIELTPSREKNLVEKWATRLYRKEREVQEYTQAVENRFMPNFLKFKETDGAVKQTAKFVGGRIFGLTVGVSTGATGANLILMGEKAAFNVAALGSSIVNKEHREILRDSTKQQFSGAVDFVTPITRDSQGRIVYDPQGTANIISAAGMVALKPTYERVIWGKKNLETGLRQGKIVQAETLVNANPTSQILAVKGQGGLRASPLSKPQLRAKSQGLPINKQGGKVRFNQGEFVQKAPKSKGIQESIRFNPVKKEATLVQKGKGVKSEFTFDSQGGVSQSVFIGKGQATTLKNNFARPPSQIKSPRVSENVPYSIQRTPQATIQTQQAIIGNKLSSAVKKYPSFNEKTGVQLISQKSPQTFQILKPIKAQQSKLNPLQQKQTDGRASVRAKLIERIKQRQAQTKQQQQQPNQYLPPAPKEKNVPQVVKENPLQVLERIGGTPSKSEFSTEAMLSGKGFVQSTGIKQINQKPTTFSSTIKEPVQTFQAGGTFRTLPDVSKYYLKNIGQNTKGLLDGGLLVQSQGSLFENTNAQNQVSSPDTDVTVIPSLRISPAERIMSDVDQSLRISPDTDINLAQNQVSSPDLRRGRTPRNREPPRIIYNSDNPNIPPKIQTPLPTMRFRNPEIKPLKLPPLAIRMKSPSLPKQKQAQGFNVFTFKRGERVRINPQPLSKADAKGFGAFKVGTTARASFELEETEAKELGIFKGGRNFLKNFTVNKKGRFIEKPSKRISTAGELREITFKGIQTKRLNR